ncbi:hypothetical protein EGW08_003240 [Elysia chlorotica]|uniref:Androgen-dependent TFPI-regulating protein n=1 Tax=Elysia chlorotica TaxID=188477 RepID=A0A3S1BQG6_ELYCH|nr:hypothetical protein EGW08_003240 [Elysia chlorotica]
MAASTVLNVFHLPVFIAFLISTYYDWFYVATTHARPFKKLYYLTYWNACLQTIYYGLCVVRNLTSDRRRGAQLGRWRDNMHACVAFPVGMFVVVTFWALFAVDRELVFPKALDNLVPFWLNHMLHTAVCPFLLLDKYLVHHQYPARHKGILTACGLSLIYLVWILFIAYYEGFWVYPVLQVLAMHERAIFISVCISFFASFYILGEALTKFFWGKASKAKMSPNSKRK